VSQITKGYRLSCTIKLSKLKEIWTDRRTDNYGQIDGHTIMDRLTDRQIWTDRRQTIMDR